MKKTSIIALTVSLICILLLCGCGNSSAGKMGYKVSDFTIDMSEETVLEMFSNANVYKIEKRDNTFDYKINVLNKKYLVDFFGIKADSLGISKADDGSICISTGMDISNYSEKQLISLVDTIKSNLATWGTEKGNVSQTGFLCYEKECDGNVIETVSVQRAFGVLIITVTLVYE